MRKGSSFKGSASAVDPGLHLAKVSWCMRITIGFNSTYLAGNGWILSLPLEWGGGQSMYWQPLGCNIHEIGINYQGLRDMSKTQLNQLRITYADYCNDSFISFPSFYCPKTR